MRRTAFTLVIAATAAFAQKPVLQFAEPPKMVSCEPAAVVPCFRAKLNIVDEQGKPLGVSLPAPEKIRTQIKIRAGESELNPFYVEKAGESQSKVKGRAALIIVDNSGSMNKKLASGESRFEAAQRAVEHFLAGFEEGADRVAVVPFESHQVQEKIAAASFVRTKESALSQVRTLPAPLEKNNTALFSAVVYGVETLQSMQTRLEQEAGEGLDTMVVILTDGNNDVGKGDDAGLLEGAAGLEQAAARVKASGIPVHAIGFSDVGGLDEDALRRISTKYMLASNVESLKSAFAFTRTLLNSRLSMAFRSPLPDRASLAGRNLPIHVELTLPDGRKAATATDAVWSAPQMGVPVYSGNCTAEEKKAVLLNTPVESSWMSIIRPILVFCGLGLLLLILWHWVPRLIWPDQYMGKIPVAGKWAGQTQISDGVMKGRPAPPGFEAGPKGVNMGPRGAQDRTVVNPQVHPDFSKTRLGNRETGPS